MNKSFHRTTTNTTLQLKLEHNPTNLDYIYITDSKTGLRQKHNDPNNTYNKPTQQKLNQKLKKQQQKQQDSKQNKLKKTEASC
jgi:hypothetical protein